MMNTKTTIIDNFELIDSLLNFPDEDTFYQLQIIRRGKDHPNMPSANRTIHSYFIDHEGKLMKLKDEIVKLCELFGARAYINLNPRSYRKCTIQVISDMAHRVNEGDFKKIYKVWNTVCGYLKPDRETAKWIVDIDFPLMQKTDEVIIDELCKIWAEMFNRKNKNQQISSEDIKFAKNIKNFIYAKIPTKGGYHLITRPFDIQKFNEIFENKIDVHKNNPTILYIPEIKKIDQGEGF